MQIGAPLGGMGIGTVKPVRVVVNGRSLLFLFDYTVDDSFRLAMLAYGRSQRDGWRRDSGTDDKEERPEVLIGVGSAPLPYFPNGGLEVNVKHGGFCQQCKEQNRRIECTMWLTLNRKAFVPMENGSP